MILWTLEDHICRRCGGRILKSAKGAGVTPGGNPIYRCADCAAGGAMFGSSDICWCGMSHRRQNMPAYQCVPFLILDEEPELLGAFRECGCEPPPPWGTNANAGEVGIVLVSTLQRLEKK